MKDSAKKEFKWLNKLVGDWKFETSRTRGAIAPSMNQCGSESVRPLGDMWVVADGQGETRGGHEATMILTSDGAPVIKKYAATWEGTTLSYLWVYKGSLNGNVLTLEAEGPADGDRILKYKDVIEVKDRNHRTTTSLVQDEDGVWQPLNKTDYRRVR